MGTRAKLHKISAGRLNELRHVNKALLRKASGQQIAIVFQFIKGRIDKKFITLSLHQINFPTYVTSFKVRGTANKIDISMDLLQMSEQER